MTHLKDKAIWLGLAVTVLLITSLMIRGLEKSAIISLAKDDCKAYRENSKFYQSCIQERIREMKSDSLLNG